ncbi:MAG: 2,3-diphosphoglycerate-dependent phosphoglycerate mutase [Candidatus Lokiarchaeota archaeon]|nr:2,3-diphosphoglycerate-dependent phosphoglycerate mutase [Candidatus Lokiarchaeota archaeon]
MYKIVFLRHGESIWNKKNFFTGWTDVDLSQHGIEEAKEAAKRLKEEGYTFDLAYTSVLVRATHTLDIVLDEMDLKDIEIRQSWRLNERHYGALQGLNKAETAKKHGEKQVFKWRRDYSTPPPALDKDDKRYPGNPDNPNYELYKDLDDNLIPTTECLKDTVARVLPYWHDEIVPQIKNGRKILISAHGNSLRALIKYLDNVPEDEISHLDIPTGIPLIYELNEDLKPIKHYYLASEEELEAEINKVKQQGKLK